MTIQEMHIAVNLGVQKIASFQADNLLPQEIDHELNNAMNRLIKQRYLPMGNKYQKGFEQSQKRIDDLRSLVSKSRLPCTYYGDSVENNQFFIERSELPRDYLFLVNILTSMYYECSSSVDYVKLNSQFKYAKVSLTPPLPGYVLTTIRYYDPSAPSAIGGNVIHKENGMDYDYYSNPLNYLLGLTAIPSNSETDQAPAGFYIENTPAADSNTLLIRLTGYAVSLFQNGWQAVWKNPLNGDVELVEYSGSELTSRTFTLRTPTEPIPPQKKVPCMYVQQDDIHALLYDPFNTTTHKYPKYVIQENFIDIYSDNKFIPTFVELTYIRHPKHMDSIQGVGCELPEHTHQEIVEMAIQSILEAFENPRYQTQSREVLESE